MGAKSYEGKKKFEEGEKKTNTGASWRCSGRHPSPPGLVLGVRCVIVWAQPSTRSFSSSGVMLEGRAVHPPTARAHVGRVEVSRGRASGGGEGHLLESRAIVV
eukprot:scaffold35652_cov107-Isochrysis_galbana.AAC.1